MCGRRILFAGFAARMEDTTAEGRDVWRTVGGRGLRDGAGKRVDEVLRGRPQLSVSTPTSGRPQPRTRGNEWRKTAEQGAERFMAKWIAAENAWAELQHAVKCPNVMKRIKERIAQHKHARAGSLVIVA